MALPSDVLTALFADLASIAAVCAPGQALERALPEPGQAPSMAVSWPEMSEEPQREHPGMAQTGVDLVMTFRFGFLCGFRDQSQGPQGRPNAIGALQAYDTGCRLRALFYGAAAVRQIAYSVTVGRIAQTPPAMSSALQTYGGTFDVTLRIRDDSHIRAYTPIAGGQPGERP